MAEKWNEDEDLQSSYSQEDASEVTEQLIRETQYKKQVIMLYHWPWLLFKGLLFL